MCVCPPPSPHPPPPPTPTHTHTVAACKCRAPKQPAHAHGWACVLVMVVALGAWAPDQCLIWCDDAPHEPPPAAAALQPPCARCFLLPCFLSWLLCAAACRPAVLIRLSTMPCCCLSRSHPAADPGYTRDACTPVLHLVQGVLLPTELALLHILERHELCVESLGLIALACVEGVAEQAGGGSGVVGSSSSRALSLGG